MRKNFSGRHAVVHNLAFDRLLDDKKDALMAQYKILKDVTDYDYPITIKDMVRQLKNKYGLEVSRKTVSRNFKKLEDLFEEVRHKFENCDINYILKISGYYYDRLKDCNSGVRFKSEQRFFRDI